MNNLKIDILIEHQFSEDGLSCQCGETYYTFPFPDRDTIREHATHQLIQLDSYSRKREWDE